MDFDLYVVARRRLLVERAVELGLDETAAAELVDGLLRSERRRIERVADPDPDLFAAVEDGVRRGLHVPSPHRGRVLRAAVVLAVVLALVAGVAAVTWRVLQPPEQVAVPSTFALESDAAAALLREAGLQVRVDDARGLRAARARRRVLPRAGHLGRHRQHGHAARGRPAGTALRPVRGAAPGVGVPPVHPRRARAGVRRHRLRRLQRP